MTKPNFIVFLTDDQGYGDLSCMGATDFKTPHLDDLATGGVRFTDWYSNCPVCSPSRAALMTGRHPGNAGVRSILAGHRTASGLPGHVPTLATALKKEGYKTAMFGKWHLGMVQQSRPNAHGFEEFFGFLAGCVDYYSHIFYWQMNRPGPGLNPTHDLWHNEKEVWDNGQYLTDLLTEKTVQYIRESANSDEPFFIYVPYNAPHYPMHAPKEYVDRFPHLAPDRRIMAAMLSAVDDGVGAIVAELKRQGIYENTCIFFTSDNGPSPESRNWLDGNQDPYYGGSAGSFKGHKSSLYEGGIRMPALISWPDQIPAGKVCNEMAASMDVFPTLLKAAGGNLDDYELDGKDLLPMLVRGAPGPHEELLWNHCGQKAIRRGNWKLVLNGVRVEGANPEDDIHLSNLEEDPGETVNLKDQHPELVKELTEKIQAFAVKIEQRWKTEFEPNISGTTSKTK